MYRPAGGGPTKGIANEETPLDEEALADLFSMYSSEPIISLGRQAFLSKALNGPFQFSIPAIGLKSNGDMETIINAYWMPFLRRVYDWWMIIGVAPYYFDVTENNHPYPIAPDFDLGFITVSINDKHKPVFRYYWNHGIEPVYEPKMLWSVTEARPSRTGEIRSPLVSLLGDYRSLIKLRRSQDVVVTQAPRPIHIMERQSKALGANNDNLTSLKAQFGDIAAGVSKQRIEEERNHAIRVKTAELHKQLQQTHAANLARSSVQPTLWTDTPETLLEEMDSGFSSRVVALLPDWKYTSAARPTLVGDYYKAQMQFNTIASAKMGFSLELIIPMGSSRSQNVQGGLTFERERTQEQNNLFAGIIKTALIIAYRKQIQQVMHDARQWRIEKLGGDPNKVIFLYPELDVQVDMSSGTTLLYEELKQMHSDGLITKDTFSKHAGKSKNLPADQMVSLSWPDNVAKELLIKPPTEKKTGSAAQPKAKKAKTGQ